MNAQQANLGEVSIYFEKQSSQLPTTKPNNLIPSHLIPLTNDFSLLHVLFNDREQFRVSYESAQKLGSLSKQQHRRSPHVWLIRQNAKDDTSQ